MSADRIIGVDFGTSTSVMRVKRYKGKKPVDERLNTKPVVFNVGSTVVPTLIRKTKTGAAYGYDAEIPKKDSVVLYQSFKVQLESADPEKKAEARELTADFMKYLGKTYREQSDGGHLGDPTDAERTIVSYPVKWSRETKDFMIEAAKSAGFPNVTGMDEASAAIFSSTLQNEETLKRKGFLKPGTPLHILLLDMGAGTTDLVLCKYTPGEKNEILSTYPKDGDILFGGREIDALLGQYIAEKVPAEFQSTILNKIGLEKYKEWKESVVSPDLKNSNPVDYFSALDDLADLLGFNVDFKLDRATFEGLLKNYLPGLPELINGCLKEAGMKGNEIDLVILTGGHSQWYFVKEMLTGKNKRFGACNLEKIEADEKRVISIPLPQETVALGLAFSELNLNVIPEKETSNEPADKKVDEKIPDSPSDSEEAFMMHIDCVLGSADSKISVVTTVSGKVERGTVRTGSTVKIGTINGEKISAVVYGIRIDQESCASAKTGDVIRLDLKIRKINSGFIQEGQTVYAFSGGFDSPESEPDSEWLQIMTLLSDVSALEDRLKSDSDKAAQENFDYAQITCETTKEFFNEKYRLICEKWPDRFHLEDNSFIGETIGQFEFPERKTITTKATGKEVGGWTGGGAIIGGILGGVIGAAIGAGLGGLIGASDNTTDVSVPNTMSFVRETIVPAVSNALEEKYAQTTEQTKGKSKTTRNKKRSNTDAKPVE